jgi:hypothetical protein
MKKQRDSVRWSKLGTAYGPGILLPSKLKGLASKEAETRAEALAHIRKAVVEAILPASSEVVPFLMDLVEDEATPDRHRILRLLTDLAAGGDTFQWQHETFSAAAVKRFKGSRKRAHDAVAEGATTYLSALTATDAKVRAAAAHLLAFVPEAAEAALASLATAVSEECVEPALASELLAAAVLSRSAGQAVDCEARLGDGRRLVRAASAIASAILRPDANQAIVVALCEALRAPTVSVDDLPWAYGRLRVYALVKLVPLAPAHPAILARLVTELQALASTPESDPDHDKVVPLASALLTVGFAGFQGRSGDLVSPSALSAEQQELLEALARSSA